VLKSDFYGDHSGTINYIENPRKDENIVSFNYHISSNKCHALKNAALPAKHL